MLVIVTRTAIGALLVAAAVNDFRTLRIPNAIPLALMGMFCVSVTVGLQQEWPSHLTSFGIASAVSVPLFFAQVWGGGDAKLSSAFALFLSPHQLERFALIVALAGGVLAITILIARRLVAAPWTQRPELPYGVALAVGGLDWVLLN